MCPSLTENINPKVIPIIGNCHFYIDVKMTIADNSAYVQTETLKPGHTAFRVLTASESRPKNGTREADAVKREEDAMKT